MLPTHLRCKYYHLPKWICADLKSFVSNCNRIFVYAFMSAAMIIKVQSLWFHTSTTTVLLLSNSDNKRRWWWWRRRRWRWKRCAFILCAMFWLWTHSHKIFAIRRNLIHQIDLFYFLQNGCFLYTLLRWFVFLFLSFLCFIWFVHLCYYFSVEWTIYDSQLLELSEKKFVAKSKLLPS